MTRIESLLGREDAVPKRDEEGLRSGDAGPEGGEGYFLPACLPMVAAGVVGDVVAREAASEVGWWSPLECTPAGPLAVEAGCCVLVLSAAVGADAGVVPVVGAVDVTAAGVGDPETSVCSDVDTGT